MSIINALINIWCSCGILFKQVQRYLCINDNFAVLKLCLRHSVSPYRESLCRNKFNNVIWSQQICEVDVIQTLLFFIFLNFHITPKTETFLSFSWFALLLLKIWAISSAHACIKRTDNSTVYYSTVTQNFNMKFPETLKIPNHITIENH